MQNLILHGILRALVRDEMNQQDEIEALRELVKAQKEMIDHLNLMLNYYKKYQDDLEIIAAKAPPDSCVEGGI
jgi:hypothetical protein